MDTEEHIVFEIDDILHRPVVERLQAVLAERSDVIVTVGDTDGHLYWGSRAGSQELFHRFPEAYYGHSRFDYVHPGDLAHVRRLFAQAVAGETAQYTCRARTADDEWRLVSTLTWRLDGPSGPMMVSITLPATASQDELTDLAWRVPKDIGP